MPHKRNPAICESISALARAARYCMAPAMESLISETERDKVVLQTEREYVSRLHSIAHAAIAKMIVLTAGVTIKADKMGSNLNITDGLLLSEAIMMALAPSMGRQEAHELIYKVSQKAFIEGRKLKEVLKEVPKVTEKLTEKDIDHLLEPSSYTGFSGLFVDRVLTGIGED